MQGPEFQEVVLREFSFLQTEFGCVPVPPEAEDIVPPPYEAYRGSLVILRNATTAVTIQYEWIEKYPTIFLTNLSNPDKQRRTFNLGLLLRLRAPEFDPLRGITRLPMPKSPELLIAEYAAALKAVATDILRGDFSVFPELERERDRSMREPRSGTAYSGDDEQTRKRLAVYVKLERAISEFDYMRLIDGKSVGRNWEAITNLARQSGFPALGDFVSTSFDDLVSMVGEDALRKTGVAVPPAQWFDAGIGLDAVRRLQDALSRNSEVVDNVERLMRDLLAYETVLTRANTESIRFHLAFDV